MMETPSNCCISTPTTSEIRLFLDPHRESRLDTVNDVLALWFRCPLNVVDASRDLDHHDASDAEASDGIEDVVFCEPPVQATLVESSAIASILESGLILWSGNPPFG